jgi:acetone carboxylase gamma subunit
MKVLDNLEVAEVKGGKVFRCVQCGHMLCLATENYKNYAAKNEAPINRYQRQDLMPKRMDRFVIREYYCPNCAAMFEVEMTTKNEKPLHSIEVKA